MRNELIVFFQSKRENRLPKTELNPKCVKGYSPFVPPTINKSGCFSRVAQSSVVDGADESKTDELAKESGSPRRDV